MSTSVEVEPDTSYLDDAPPLPPDVEMVTEMRVTPRGFELFLKVRGDRRRPLIKYHDGSLTLVSPLSKHERAGDRLDELVKAVCNVLGIDFASFASTLYRRRGKKHGIEPDESYYIANVRAALELGDAIDRSAEPPPDLVVEVVVSNPVKKSLRICQELGVPEVWVYRPRTATLVFLALDAQGEGYTPSAASRSFPFLTPVDVLPWVIDETREPDNARETRLRAWVRDTLAPRRDAGPKPPPNPQP